MYKNDDLLYELRKVIKIKISLSKLKANNTFIKLNIRVHC